MISRQVTFTPLRAATLGMVLTAGVPGSTGLSTARAQDAVGASHLGVNSSGATADGFSGHISINNSGTSASWGSGGWSGGYGNGRWWWSGRRHGVIIGDDWYWRSRRGWWGYEPYYDLGARPFRSTYSAVDPNLMPGRRAEFRDVKPQEPLTPYQLALIGFERGRYADAAAALRTHLTADPEDVASMRLLAVALLGSRRAADASAAMRLAYAIDPVLAARPLDFGAAKLPATAPRDLVRLASTFANRAGTGSGWLLVAVLMQADGRVELADKMLDKAIAAGLTPDIAAPLRNAFLAARQAQQAQRDAGRSAAPPAAPAAAAGAGPADTRPVRAPAPAPSRQTGAPRPKPPASGPPPAPSSPPLPAPAEAAPEPEEPESVPGPASTPPG